jgi:hypothetical protein
VRHVSRIGDGEKAHRILYLGIRILIVTDSSFYSWKKNQGDKGATAGTFSLGGWTVPISYVAE